MTYLKNKKRVRVRRVIISKKDVAGPLPTSR